ncbi:glycoside hydrolase N-terminal domain-containing protein [Mitsuaria sp. TWR114]|uniref:glycoside hydrolase family 95 protein n=1 Tax=Mitsuaria sp. TWR114 TaxID=2601731 RepID=UPI0021084340|nr:glycoside hydrolase family 95 protein [Mitsuaria sp. TWR114]
MNMHGPSAAHRIAPATGPLARLLVIAATTLAAIAAPLGGVLGGAAGGVAGVMLLGALAPAEAMASELRLFERAPAPDTPEGWERQALPIGNGRLGAMLFGGLARDRIQFNENTLWVGDGRTMGAYQPFGDLVLTLPGHDAEPAAASGYRRELDIGDALHRVSYTHGGTRFTREVIASHPAQAIVLRLSADRGGQYSGSLALTDRHGARVPVADQVVLVRPRQQATGALPNGMRYAAQARVIAEGGLLRVEGGRLVFQGCDALTIVLGAGTSYLPDATKAFDSGIDPLPRVAAQVTAASAQPWTTLRARHVADHQRSSRGSRSTSAAATTSAARCRPASACYAHTAEGATRSWRRCTRSTVATC